MAWVFYHVHSLSLLESIESHIILPWELPQKHRPSVQAERWTPETND